LKSSWNPNRNKKEIQKGNAQKDFPVLLSAQWKSIFYNTMIEARTLFRLDSLKLSMLHTQNGRWNGEHLVSEDWVTMRKNYKTFLMMMEATETAVFHMATSGECVATTQLSKSSLLNCAICSSTETYRFS